MTTKERRNIPGLGADRADIMVAGLAIVDRIMVRLKANVLRVHTGGVRDGLLLHLLEGAEPRPADRSQQQLAVDRFAISCGVDFVHSRHTAWLAGELFDALAHPFSLDPQDRRLLEASATLQDVGYLINYRAHHKHSFQLILNSRLPGFRKHELAMIANIARYHRGASPSKKHANFRHLSPADQLRVRRLAAILRLAGGLDRGYSQRVREVTTQVQPGKVIINVQATDDPELELWATRARSRMFEKAFGVSVAVASQWGSPQTVPDAAETVST